MSHAFAPPFEFDAAELLEAVSGTVDGAIGSGPWRVVTDSRHAHPGTLFVALSGDHFDGHRFVDGVLGRGGTGVVVAADHPSARAELPHGCFRIRVADTLTALGELARWVRRTADVPVVGITGSAGKTTTKEMIAAALQSEGEGLATAGNFNNLVGLPVTLLRLAPEHRWMVLEMGMSAAGEIRALARIAEPTIRVITNVAPAHLEFFGDLDAVARAKGELFEDANPGHVLIANADDPRSALFPRPEGVREIRFGADPSADVRILRVDPRDLDGSRTTISVLGDEVSCDLPLPGRHNAHNAAAALAVAWAAGVTPRSAADALGEMRIAGGRMQIETVGGVQVIDDTYNANPRSVAAALETLVSGHWSGRSVAVLGDMFELGDAGPDLHRQVGEVAAGLGIDLLLALGALSRETVEAATSAGASRAEWYEEVTQICDRLSDFLRPGDRLLVKGSRGMRMERVIDGWKETVAC